MSLFSAYILLLWSQHFAVSGKKHNTLRNRYEKYPLEIHFLRKNLGKIWEKFGKNLGKIWEKFGKQRIFSKALYTTMSKQEVYRRRNTNIHTLVSLPWQHVLNKIFLLENVFSLEWILGGSNCCCIVFNNCYFH